MTEEMYSVEQVAERLGLHVRTVRGYIRSGQLRAARIGKQYRIAARDLAALTGSAAPAAPVPPAGPVEVSSIVRIDGVDRGAADRLGTLVQAGAATRHDPGPPLRLQTMYDDERNRMTLVILGDPTATADLLRLVDSVLDGVLGRD
ncbi:helix-turn-helix domain-containing protein [Micromonospora sp. WMMD558]|uniref:helix-turn-helix domain-containing protein n=1 Tax=Micromonospora sp. WMMD558 TaxID=3403462 RepID=UPI003BF5E38B